MSYTTVVFLAAPIITGILIGYAVGGRPSGLATLRPRALWLLWTAVAAQVATHWIPAAFALVITWIAVNLRQRRPVLRAAGAAILLGVLLNGTAILVNGRMPYSPTAAAAAGASTPSETPRNEPADADSRLTVLADVIPVPVLRAVVSPGDILIATGVVAALAGAMHSARRRRPPGACVAPVVPVERR
ncbi:DUF5317 family protein [Actinoplanes sp. NBRC 101535]|uniref:DUF5317 family protein n=1 Tax=Actinoplanes sp. NBRC 101535 TaxID=3032196 RepID=UPI0024A44F65|nr:DUF5317 family protein [Actinoplanes sp. NBRC 101535]GLY03763.1 hypothetical protein Acsp01_41420 [Actinoplanes sp. NBRC 101535]